MRIFLSLVGVVGGLCLVLAGVLFWMKYHIDPLSEQQSVSVWLPKNAEIRSSKEVQPGTFKITVSLGEFQEKTDLAEWRVLVVYFEMDPNLALGPFLEYWLPRGDGTFYYARVDVLRPKVRLSFLRKWSTSWDVHFMREKETASFVYIPKGSNTLLPGIMVGVVGIFLLGVWVTKSSFSEFWYGQRSVPQE